MRVGVEMPAGARAMLVTPPGRGAVATIVVSGADAVVRVGDIFVAASGIALADAALGRIVFGRWGGATGEEVVVCRVADDEVEIHCHGGEAAAGRILQDLEAHGVLIADWRTTLVAEFAGAIRGEALIALTQAATARTAAILWEQYRGALLREIEAIKAAIDARDIAKAQAVVRELLRRAAMGLKLTSPWRVAIVGRPNVGKSSLLNALLGYGRAIVHEQPGTTRDLVTGLTACDGWPCQLIDTAGLRDTDEPIERAGVRLVAEALREADLALWVRDATSGETDEELRGVIPADAMVVWNKCDLVTEASTAAGERVSALTGAGIEGLVAAIGRRVVASAPGPGEGVPFTVGQVERLRRVERLLTAGEVVEAAGVMAEWLGAQRHGFLPGEICEPS